MGSQTPNDRSGLISTIIQQQHDAIRHPFLRVQGLKVGLDPFGLVSCGDSDDNATNASKPRDGRFLPIAFQESRPRPYMWATPTLSVPFGLCGE
jgi:hypothetical protein